MDRFEYHVTGRDGYYLVVSLIAIFAVFGAVLMQAPWWILVLWGAGAAGLIWRYYFNPKSGMVLGGHTWRFYGAGRKAVVPLEDIVRVQITTESDGADQVRLHLNDGIEIELPEESYPATHKLVAQLDQRGVAVEQS